MGARRLTPTLAVFVTLALAACDGNVSIGSAKQESNQKSSATRSGLQLVASEPGVSPFIAWLSLHLISTADLKAVEFAIQPKAWSTAKAVDVRYTGSALLARGYMTTAATTLSLPIFALYGGYRNQVTVNISFLHGPIASMNSAITTADYADPSGIYEHPTILKQRCRQQPSIARPLCPELSLGFHYFVVKSGMSSPVIVNTDGEVGSAVPGIDDSVSSAFEGDQFIIGDASAAVVHQIRLDGTATQSSVTEPSVRFFHHDIDHGYVGLLAEVTTQINGVQNPLSNLVQMTEQGSLLNQWDLGAASRAPTCKERETIPPRSFGLASTGSTATPRSMTQATTA